MTSCAPSRPRTREATWAHCSGTLERHEEPRRLRPTQEEIDRAVTEFRQRLGEGAVDRTDPVKVLDVTPGTAAWTGLAYTMMRAEIEALDRTLERDRGDYAGQPRDPVVKPPKAARRPTAKPGDSIRERLEEFARDNPRRAYHDRIDQTKRDVARSVQPRIARRGVKTSGRLGRYRWVVFDRILDVKSDAG